MSSRTKVNLVFIVIAFAWGIGGGVAYSRAFGYWTPAFWTALGLTSAVHFLAHVIALLIRDVTVAGVWDDVIGAASR